MNTLKMKMFNLTRLLITQINLKKLKQILKTKLKIIKQLKN